MILHIHSTREICFLLSIRPYTISEHLHQSVLASSALLCWLLEPSLSSFLAFLKVGIVVSVWLATPPVRKCAVLAVCWIYVCQKLRQLLITHRPDAVGVCNWFCSIRTVRVIAFINFISILHRASLACTLSHNHSHSAGCCSHSIVHSKLFVRCPHS